jgi:hypothetical protein
LRIEETASIAFPEAGIYYLDSFLVRTHSTAEKRGSFIAVSCIKMSELMNFNSREYIFTGKMNLAESHLFAKTTSCYYVYLTTNLIQKSKTL